MCMIVMMTFTKTLLCIAATHSYDNLVVGGAYWQKGPVSHIGLVVYTGTQRQLSSLPQSFLDNETIQVREHVWVVYLTGNPFPQVRVMGPKKKVLSLISIQNHNFFGTKSLLLLCTYGV